MIVKWSNIVLFALVVLAFAWAVRAQDSILRFLSRMGSMGPEHPTDERICGLMAFGLVLVVLAGVLRILITNLTRK